MFKVWNELCHSWYLLKTWWSSDAERYQRPKNLGKGPDLSGDLLPEKGAWGTSIISSLFYHPGKEFPVSKPDMFRLGKGWEMQPRDNPPIPWSAAAGENLELPPASSDHVPRYGWHRVPNNWSYLQHSYNCSTCWACCNRIGVAVPRIKPNQIVFLTIRREQSDNVALTPRYARVGAR